MSNSKTVLIIASHYPPNLGGIESHLQALVTALTKRSWNVIVSTYQPLASRKTAPKLEKQKGLIIYRFPWLGFNMVHKLTPYPALEFLYLFPGLFLVTLITFMKHRRDIHVIHCQGLVPTVVGVLIGKIFSRRVISSIHNLYFFPSKGAYPFFAKWTFLQSDTVLAPTNIARQELISIGVPEDKISSFRYWIDLSRFSPTDRRKGKKRLSWEKFTVFFVGRLIETKGVGILLKMARTLNSNIQLVIAGDGSMKSEVEEAQKKLDNVIYLGRVENQDLPLYYSSADLVIVPSLVDEGWGFVVMEATACGTPVLASDKGGLSDAVSIRIGKLVVPTALNFKKWIEHFSNNQSALKKLARNTHRYAKTNFSEDVVEDIIKIYER